MAGPVPPVPSADELYSQLEGKCFQGNYEGTHEMWSTKWHTFSIQSMDPAMKDILDNIMRLYENRIWKGFIPLLPLTYKIYVQDINKNSFIEGALYSLQIVNCICFSPDNWMLTRKYADKKGYCINVKVVENIQQLSVTC